jgi:hypothetical protein
VSLAPLVRQQQDQADSVWRGVFISPVDKDDDVMTGWTLFYRPSCLKLVLYHKGSNASLVFLLVVANQRFLWDFF